MTRFTLILAFLAAACGDDSGDNPDSARPPDGGPGDARPDAGPSCVEPSLPGPCTIDYFLNEATTAGETLTYTYDGQMRLTTIDDDHADATPDVLSTYTYDTSGQLISFEKDVGKDGSVNYAEDYTYDSTGNQTLISVDTDGDGTANFTRTRQYDAAGKEIGQSVDADASGSPDQLATFSYDDAGNLVLAEYDFLGDGETDVDGVISQEYDALGNLIRRTTDGNNVDVEPDGVVDTLEEWDYGFACELVQHRLDAANDGSWELVDDLTYDGEYNPITEDSDVPPGGVLEFHREYHYDCW